MAVESTLASSLSLIFRLSAPQVLEYLRPLWNGVDDELQKLQKAMLRIQSIIRDAEERQVEDKAVKDWLTELKHAAYDAEDVLDQVNTHPLVLHRKSELGGHLTTRKVRNLFSFDNPCLFLLELGSKLKEIILRIDGIIKEMHKFSFKVDNQARQRDRTQTRSSVDETKEVGRDADRDEIVQRLIDYHHLDEKVTVFSIVAIGGLGKTTLAQLVYNDYKVKRCFEPCIWVSISDDFNHLNVARAIIRLATKGRCDLPDFALHQQKLKQVLEMKRYLLVLDDVWNQDKEKWDMLNALLTCGQKGSTLVVTTRHENCSRVMNAQVTYHLPCLSEKDSWDLFEQHAFERDALKHQNMVTIGKKIVNKCGGLPLAIKASGRVMRPMKKESELQFVLESGLWNFQPIRNEILPTLWLSYVEMPEHLKKCFSFCATFPKDCMIEKELLIELWIANGFIPSKPGMNLEVECNEIFNELVWRSFLQDVKPTRDSPNAFHFQQVRHVFYREYGYISARTCKIHDVMHDLTIYIAWDEISVNL